MEPMEPIARCLAAARDRLASATRRGEASLIRAAQATVDELERAAEMLKETA